MSDNHIRYRFLLQTLPSILPLTQHPLRSLNILSQRYEPSASQSKTLRGFIPFSSSRLRPGSRGAIKIPKHFEMAGYDLICRKEEIGTSFQDHIATLTIQLY